MPNFVITNVCNLSCPFCFASEYHEEPSSKNAARMPLDEFVKQLEFVGAQDARFCGGEPTLHPQFIEMLTHALARKKGRAFLMTNGVWPSRVREHIAGLPRRLKKRVGFLVNVLSAEHYAPGQREELHKTLGTLRRDMVTLGVTIYQAPFDTSHVFNLADEFGFGRVRYSVASPNVTDPRSWHIDAKRDYPPIANIVYELTMKARERDLYIHSDCGYIPPCMFSEEQLAAMYPPGDPELAEAFSCRGPVDIGPGGEAWRCYGLYSSMRAKTAEFEDSASLGQHFERRTEQTSFTPLFDECNGCEIRERYACAGGCYALRSVASMQARASDNLVSLGDDPRFHDAVPEISNSRVHVMSAAENPVVMVQEEDGTWAELHLSPWEGGILMACDGRSTVAEVISGAKADTAARGAHRSAARVIRRLYEQGAISMTGGPQPPGGN